MVKPKILLGLGNAVDYEVVWNSVLIESLVQKHKILEAEIRSPACIDSERTLVLSILSFLKTGNGGERTVDNNHVLEEFAGHLKDYIVTLGGTPVRAALAMQNLQQEDHRSNHDIVLHLTTVNDHVRRRLPTKSRYICSNDKDTLSPHLIVQFEKGDIVSTNGIQITAPQSNRIIYLNDSDNILMNIDEAAFKKEAHDATIILISGFNAMQSEELLKRRLDMLNTILSKSNANVFYEDGGFYNPEFRQTIFTHPILQKFDFVSMNEDELQSYLRRSVKLLNASDMASALKDLSASIRAQHIIVHTQYWALCYGENASTYKASLRGGVTMATTRYCHGDDFALTEYQAVGERPPNEEQGSFVEQLEKGLGDAVCCVPVAEIHGQPETVTSVGLGDAFVGGFLLALANERGRG